MTQFRSRRADPLKQTKLPQPYNVLLPLTYPDEAGVLLPLAEILVQEYRGQLIILNTLAVAEGESLSGSASQASRFRESLTGMMSDLLSITAQIQTMVRPESEIWDGIWETVTVENIDLLVLGLDGETLQKTAMGKLSDSSLADPPCAVAVVRPAASISGPEGWKAVERILMPVRGGRHSTLTLRVGYALAQQTGASITLLHVKDSGTQASDEQFSTEFDPAVKELENITRSITIKGDISRAIIEEAPGHQVLVMGAPSFPPQKGAWGSPLLDEVTAGTDTTIVSVKERRKQEILPLGREEPVAVQIDRPVALVVDKWFAENTYHSREFADLGRLVALKKGQGLTISLGLPALNEEKTVGNVIRTIKTTLMDEYELLDEIVLIDSGSFDYTREIATDLGIPVYVHQEILPQYGAYRGKGEALWKSLYVLSGDIVAWIDTDISNIHPRFVFGILGPLLRQPNIQYVKGFYRRPLREGDKYIAGGGGRVTELTARPFFNLFYPELSGMIQPLSGEYAARRSAVERLPFYTGYGVETGLLIDILEEFGLGALAQVDLLERIHHNQPLPSLSKMSFAITQVVMRRLERRHRVQLLEEANLTMNLIRYGQRRRYYLEPEEVRERERPPMIALPEYRQRRGLE